MYMYIRIYVYLCMYMNEQHVYIYIYVYIERLYTYMYIKPLRRNPYSIASDATTRATSPARPGHSGLFAAKAAGGAT